MNVILPIGSVVKIRDTKEPVMIFGYLQKSSGQPEKIVDYVAVPYPVGNINIFANNVFFFKFNDLVFFTHKINCFASRPC